MLHKRFISATLEISAPCIIYRRRQRTVCQDQAACHATDAAPSRFCRAREETSEYHQVAHADSAIATDGNGFTGSWLYVRKQRRKQTSHLRKTDEKKPASSARCGLFGLSRQPVFTSYP